MFVMEAIWGTSPDDISVLNYLPGAWMIPGLTYLSRFDGQLWTPKLNTLRFTYDFSYYMDMWASGPDDYYIVADGVVEHHNGLWRSEVQALVEAYSFIAVGGSASDDVYAVGEAGILFHYDGAAWTELHLTSRDLKSVWAPNSTNVFIVGDGVFIHGHEMGSHPHQPRN